MSQTDTQVIDAVVLSETTTPVAAPKRVKRWMIAVAAGAGAAVLGAVALAVHNNEDESE